MIQLPIVQKFNQNVVARCFSGINTLGPFRDLNGKLNGKDLTPQNGCEEFKSSHIQHSLPKLPWFYVV